MALKRRASSNFKVVKKLKTAKLVLAELDACLIVYQRLVVGDEQFMNIAASVDGIINLQLLYKRASETPKITDQEVLKALQLFNEDT